ncbi:alpha/beta hydrolase [uncultured Shimia sp.]|uniref:alpha/beta fold hydrolase n=1 Tax=uncultured Shimia sp. TaxID=573152 RepID=UPI00260AD205|nr:alpha/beta hydrolase [uncultured Shimia sp.]
MTFWAYALGAAAALPVIREVVRKPVSQRQPVDPEGKFAELSDGRIYYRWHGPKDGPIAVCVHGLTTPSFVWDGLIPLLVAQGFRVLSFDLYGRGLSDRPRGRQTSAFFTSMLSQILRDQEIEGKVTLFGNSMGSAVATCFAAQHPDRVRQLVLCVPAGMGHDLGLSARLTKSVPLIGDWLFHMNYPRVLRRGIEAERGLSSTVPGIVDRQLDELRWRGYLRSILSSIRGVLASPLKEDHRSLCDFKLPVLAIWGGTDDVISISCKDRLAQWNPMAQHILIPEAGHGLIYTHTNAMWDVLSPKLLMD